MKKAICFLLMPLSCIGIISCKKAGLGGDNTVVVYPQHHGRSIFSHTIPNYRDTVYVKFNATELPGTRPKDFDKIFIGELGEEHVHVHGLQIGKYFFYAAGWDTTINQRVSGGISYELKDLTAESVLYVPVTE
jgi:hypothetical protein